jgi:hypothetical protein
MADISSVAIMDLLSTGYFFEDLKKYPKSTEMDLLSYSRDYVIPYLRKKSEFQQETNQAANKKILGFAYDLLFDANDDEMVAAIFGLKKVATSEIELNEKMLSQIGQHLKFKVSLYHNRTESAKCLLKLLVNIIRTFKLTEIISKNNKSEGMCDSFDDAIKCKWQASVQQSALEENAGVSSQEPV